MTGRRVGQRVVLWAGLAVAILQSACGTEVCGGAMCGCRPADCPDFRTTSGDGGTTIRMAVGQWISLELPDRSTPAAGSSSDPKVIRLEGGTRSAFINYQKVYASFQALKVGSSLLTFGYVTCPAAVAGQCSYQVDVRVVQFPKAQVTISNVYQQTQVRLRVGQVARFEAPYATTKPGTVTIDAPSVVEWAVEPIYTVSLLQAAVVAKSPGTAHVEPDPCSDPGIVCSNPWRLTFTVT